MVERGAERVEVVVVGCGAAGLAAAAELARRGRRVLGLDRFPHGHLHGSSHGTERIVRAAYADAVHVEMVLASIEGWRRLEQESGTALLTPTGGIDAGGEEELTLLAAACEGAGVEVTMLGPAEAMARFSGTGGPLFTLDGAVLHHASSTVHADRTLEALRALAASHGAELRADTVVTGVDLLDGGQVAVRHGAGTVVADTCVVTVGAWGGGGWLDGVLGEHGPLPPLRVTQEQVGFFRPRDGAAWPTFVFRDEPTIYGLPTPDGLVKIGEHHTGPVVEPGTRTGRLDEPSWERLLDAVRRAVPGVDPEPVRSTTCLYASFPGDTFLLDRAGPVVIGLGLSGHGFKFVPEVGRRLADLADRIEWPGNPFGFDRPPLPVGASGQR